jgi:putative hydrolase of the HAD superfamily
MASASSLPDFLMSELRREIADRGVRRSAEATESYVPPAKIPPDFARLHGADLPRTPLAVAVDVYGTLLGSATGEIGPGGAIRAIDSSTADSSAEEEYALGLAFPRDMAARLRAFVAADHEAARSRGIPWPEVDAASVFARALGLGTEDGARACVAWECAVNPCAAMPGAAEFLASCAARGRALGIVSNAQFYTPLFIEEAFGASLFASEAIATETAERPCLGFEPGAVLWSYETGRAKPDPWMFKELARRMAARGVEPERILYVGNDALNDCAAAGEAGLMTALFCGDARSCKWRPGEPRVEACPPGTLVLSWDELRRIVCT